MPIDWTALSAIATMIAAIAAAAASWIALSNLRVTQTDIKARQRPYVHVPRPKQVTRGSVIELEFTIVNSGSLPARIEAMTLGRVDRKSDAGPEDPRGNLLVYPDFRNRETFTVRTEPVLNLELRVSYDVLGSKTSGGYFFRQPMTLTLQTPDEAKGPERPRYKIAYGREIAN
jgi:hypothetical protein